MYSAWRRHDYVLSRHVFVDALHLPVSYTAYAMSSEEERWRTQIHATISDPRDHTVTFNFNQPVNNEKAIIIGLGGFVEHRTQKRTAEYYSEVTKFSDGSRISQKTCIETEETLYCKSKSQNNEYREVQEHPTTGSSETPITISVVPPPTDVHDEYRITTTRLL